MNEELGMDKIEQRVLLLGLYKAPEHESFKETLLTLEQSNLFDLKTGKKYLKNLKQLKYIDQNKLTLLGIAQAKKIELEFKL